MDKRKAILSAIGILLIVAAVFGAKVIIDSNVKEDPVVEKTVNNVLVRTVENRTVPINIPANGNVTALRKMELFSEVEGIFQDGSQEFRPGERYERGELLLQVNSEEFQASLQSQKSELFNTITSIMPDLRLDFPEAFPKWEAYLSSFDINQPVPPLPEAGNETVNYFITGRGIVSAYYNIKNLEERLRKFTISAPYNGILTEALVTRGTLIRPGQKLGEFIDPSVYELEVSLRKKFTDLLEIGEEVTLNNLDGTRSFSGEISRINARVDQTSQTVQVYIRVEDEAVREGMYLEAQLKAKAEENAIEVPRELLVDQSKLFVVRDGVLNLVEVNPVYFADETVVVKGLKDGEQLISAHVPGAYSGMLVSTQKDTTKTR